MTADLDFKDASTLSITVDADSLGINFTCPSESYSMGSDGTISLPGATTAGDCLKEGLDKYGVDLKSIKYNSGSNSIDLSLKKSIINVDITLNKVGSDAFKEQLKSTIMAMIAHLKLQHNDVHAPIVGDFLKKMADTMVEGGMCVEYTGAGLEVLDDAKQHWGKWGEDLFDLVFAGLFEYQSFNQYCAPLLHKVTDELEKTVEEVEEIPEYVKNAFEGFKKKHDRVYEGEEHEYRLSVFYDNLKFIEDFYKGPKKNYQIGINSMADLTHEEFKMMYVGNKYTPKPEEERNVVILSEGKIDLAAGVDWRTKGIVNPVKNQGGCGSCWAFSAVAAMEGAYAQKNGGLKSFSEQQLVDCSKKYGNNGCHGGLMDYAFKYAETNEMETESAYKYTARDGTCKYVASKGVFNTKSYHDVSKNSPSQL